MRIKNKKFPSAFTLVELLVVVAIIVILLSITLPVLSLVRRSACKMNCQSQIAALDSACQQYNLDQNYFPGYEVNTATAIGVSCWPSYTGLNTTTGATWPAAGVTMTEKMVLYMMGGLVPVGTTNTRAVGVYPYNGAQYNKTIWKLNDPVGYDPFAVGKGPLAGPLGTIPPLVQLNCYYKYKADELVDFDGNGIYEFKDKGFIGMPILCYFPVATDNNARQNGSKYFNGPSGSGGRSPSFNYKIYDPRHPEIVPVLDDVRNGITHYLQGTYGGGPYLDLSNRWAIYSHTWPSSGTGGSGDLCGGTNANPNTFQLISAGPDGIFGPDPKTTVRANGVQLDPNTAGSADQQKIRQLIQDCDDCTNWVRK